MKEKRMKDVEEMKEVKMKMDAVYQTERIIELSKRRRLKKNSEEKVMNEFRSKYRFVQREAVEAANSTIKTEIIFS